MERVEEELKNSDADILIIDSYGAINRRGIDFAAKLKVLAKKYQKQVLVISNVSRNAEIRDNKRPQKEDMIETMCDSLWDSSDSVIFLYRDIYYNLGNNNVIEINIAKNSLKSDYGRTFGYDFNRLILNFPEDEDKL